MSVCRCAGSRLLLWARLASPRVASLHLSAPHRDQAIQQLQRMMAKHRKKHWFQSRFKPEVLQGSPDNWLGGPRKQGRGEDGLRARTVNSLLQGYIVDLMSTSEVGPEVCNLPMEIVKVKISADSSACRVYWRGLGSTEQDEGTAQTLQRHAKHLRYLLISYRLIGNVPPIVFVRDKQYAAVAEVEHLLARIRVDGFGDELETPEGCPEVAEHATSGLPSSAGPFTEPGGEAEAWGPPLPADVFGVDRAAMLRQIAAHKKGERERPSDEPEPAADEWLQLQRQQQRRLKQEKQAKNKKARRREDEDITPAEYLARRLQHDETRGRQQAEWHGNELDNDDGGGGDGNGVTNR